MTNDAGWHDIRWSDNTAGEAELYWDNTINGTSDNGIQVYPNVIYPNKNEGGKALDIKELQEFKKLSKAEKVNYIIDHASQDVAKAVKLLALWLSTLDKD